MHALSAVGLALLTAVASCPRGEATRLSKPEYERRVQTLYAGIQASFQATRDASGTALAEAIDRAQQALRGAADELEAARPPADVEAENHALAEGMREYARDLDPARRAAAAGDDETMARFADASTSPGVRAMAEAAEEMKRKGYELGPIAKD